MKLVTFSVDEEERIGAFTNEEKIVDLNKAYELYLSEVEGRDDSSETANKLIPPNMIRFLEGGEESIQAARRTLNYVQSQLESERMASNAEIIYDTGMVKLKSPIPRPPINILGMHNSPEILKEAIKFGVDTPPKAPSEPAFMIIPSTIVTGSGDPIVLPRASKMVVNECKLCVIIGKYAWKVPLERAKEHIAGYTVHNDVSASDLTRVDPLLYCIARAKSFPSFKPFGPCMVLKDGIENPHNLRFTVKVNGKIKQAGSTGENIFTAFQFVSSISHYFPLEVGTMITTGAWMGTEIRTPLKYLTMKPGDVWSNEIEGIGILQNPVVAEE